MSVTPPNVPVLEPLVTLNETEAPPARRLFPNASFACSDTDVDAPEATFDAPTVTREFTVEIAPGVTVIVGSVLLTDEPPIVAPIVVAEPDVVPEKVAA